MEQITAEDQIPNGKDYTWHTYYKPPDSLPHHHEIFSVSFTNDLTTPEPTCQDHCCKGNPHPCTTEHWLQKHCMRLRQNAPTFHDKQLAIRAPAYMRTLAALIALGEKTVINWRRHMAAINMINKRPFLAVRVQSLIRLFTWPDRLERNCFRHERHLQYQKAINKTKEFDRLLQFVHGQANPRPVRPKLSS